MLGFAIGCIGLRFEEWCLLTIDEYAEVSKSYVEREQQRERGEWERMRLLASICIQPHVKKRIKATELLPLPWDEKSCERGRCLNPERGEEPKTPKTKEERERQKMRVLEKVKNEKLKMKN